MSDGKTVLIVGTGTIGEPLIGLFLSTKKELGVDKVIFHKHTPRELDRPLLQSLQKRGALMSVEKEKEQEFKEIGTTPDMTFTEALEQADVIIDATKKGVGLKNKENYYKKYDDGKRGFLAQGSEFGFGTIYAAGINDHVLDSGERWFTIASCNTHAGAAIVRHLGFDENGKYAAKNIDLLYMRRANDVTQVSKFVPAPTVSLATDPEFGTHQARDVYEIFKTMNIHPKIHSYAILINTNLMHTVYFNIALDYKTTVDEIIDRIDKEPWVTWTIKLHSNQVFSFGRDHGHYGRILSQAVIVRPSLTIDKDNHLRGFVFTPQDGNSLISSIIASTKIMYPEREVMDIVKPFEKWLFREV